MKKYFCPRCKKLKTVYDIDKTEELIRCKNCNAIVLDTDACIEILLVNNFTDLEED